jgi:hypothetical protein
MSGGDKYIRSLHYNDSDQTRLTTHNLVIRLKNVNAVT